MADKKTLELQIKIAAEKASATVTSLSRELKNLSTQSKQFSGNSSEISKTIQSLEKDTKRFANSIKIFGSDSGNLRAQQQSLKEAILDLTGNGLDPESEAVKNLKTRYDELSSQAKKVQQDNGEMTASFGQLQGAITALASVAALGKTVQVVASLTAKALDAADSFQNARNEFGVMLGDMQAGAALFEKIKAFNDVTPFSLEATKQAVAVLKTAKVPIDELTSKLTQFGDLSKGNTEQFSSFIRAFGKGAAKGAVDMEVLNTFIDQGIPILRTLGEQSGKTEAEIIKMASNGKLSFEAFDEAIKTMTSSGGAYYGNMLLGSQSLKAMQEGLTEATTSLAASYGEMLLPAVKAVLGAFTSFVQAIDDSPLLKGILAGVIVAVTASLAAMAIKQVALTVKTWLAYAAQMGFNSALAVTNPLLIAGIAAATAATIAVVAYAANQQKAADATNELSLKQAAQGESARNATAAITDYAQSLQGLSNVQLSSMMSGLEVQIADIEKRIGNLKKYNVSPENEGFKTLQKELEDTYAKWAEVRGKITDNNRSLFVGLYDKTDRGQIETLKKDIESVKSLIDTAYDYDANGALYYDKNEIDAVLKMLLDQLKQLEDKGKATAANIGREWQDKLLTGIDAINAEQAKSAAALADNARKIYGDNYKTQAGYIAELAALNTYYDNKRAESLKKDYEKMGSVWRDKFLTPQEEILAEVSRAAKELEGKYSKSAKSNVDTAAYQAELASLFRWEADERRRLEREAILSAHQARLDAIKNEMEYQKELARNNIETGNGSAKDYANFAGGEFAGQIADTDLMSTISSGGNPLFAFITAIIEATLAIENVQKTLNFATTIVDAAFEVIGPLINDQLQPLVDILEELGNTAGNILAPAFQTITLVMAPINALLKILLEPIRLLGEVFVWLNNCVIVPVGNAFIDMINGLIDLLNKIPFVNIKRLDRLRVIGDLAVEMAEEMKKQSELVKKKYQRQVDTVESLLKSQLDSLQAQYELGWISRDEYEAQAEKYASIADEKIYDINVQMEKHLANLESLARTGKPLASWDVGSPDIPFDHIAMVHKGEAIVPRTFADGIRSGDLALVGGRSSPVSSGSQIINVTVTVNGSVISERELVGAVYEGIASGIESGEYSPLPV